MVATLTFVLRGFVIALTMVVASGCGQVSLPGLPGSKTAPAKAAPYLATPQVGECHNLTLKGIAGASDTSKPVACSEPHTARTVAVVPEPAGANRGTEDDRAEAVGRACGPAFVKELGGTARGRAKTMYSLAWFGPTKAQRAKGAHWLRCDVTLTDPRHAYRIKNAAPLLAKPPADRELRCGRVGSRKKLSWEYVPCSADHQFEPKKFIEAPPDVAYKAAEAGAKKACQHGIYTWTPSELWGTGDRFYICWRVLPNDPGDSLIT